MNPCLFPVFGSSTIPCLFHLFPDKILQFIAFFLPSCILSKWKVWYIAKDNTNLSFRMPLNRLTISQLSFLRNCFLNAASLARSSLYFVQLFCKCSRSLSRVSRSFWHAFNSARSFSVSSLLVGASPGSIVWILNGWNVKKNGLIREKKLY